MGESLDQLELLLLLLIIALLAARAVSIL